MEDLGGVFNWDLPCCRARSILYQTVGRLGGRVMRQEALAIVEGFQGIEYRSRVEAWIRKWFDAAQMRRKLRQAQSEHTW